MGLRRDAAARVDRRPGQCGLAVKEPRQSAQRIGPSWHLKGNLVCSCAGCRRYDASWAGWNCTIAPVMVAERRRLETDLTGRGAPKGDGHTVCAGGPSRASRCRACRLAWPLRGGQIVWGGCRTCDSRRAISPGESRRGVWSSRGPRHSLHRPWDISFRSATITALASRSTVGRRSKMSRMSDNSITPKSSSCPLLRATAASRASSPHAGPQASAMLRQDAPIIGRTIAQAFWHRWVGI